MTEAEAEIAYRQVLDMLREGGLGWLAGEVASEVAAGKSVPKKLSAPVEYLAGDMRWGPPRRSRKPAEFTYVVPYTSAEMLSLLLRIVESTILTAPAMQREVGSVVATNGRYTIDFVSEEAGVAARLHAGDESNRLSAAEKLQTLISQLRSEIPDGTQSVAP
jgi:hypothetical protein